MIRSTMVPISIVVALVVLGVGGRILAGPPMPQQEGSLEIEGDISATDSVRSGFSYQGRVTDTSGTPLDGEYDMGFQFWDAPSGPSQVGDDIEMKSVKVKDGLFDVTINVPYEFFDGTALWLRVKVGDEWLDARQEILPVPYAMSLWPGANVRGEMSAPNSILAAVNESSGSGIRGESHGNTGWYEYAGVTGYSTYTRTYGVLGQSEHGIGIGGWLTNPDNSQDAVNGWTEGSGVGVRGHSAGNDGVYGTTGDDTGWYEYAGVRGSSTYTHSFGVLGESEYGIGVQGRIDNPDNWHASIDGWNEGRGAGVQGYSLHNRGVIGRSDDTDGVYGATQTDTGWYEHAGVRGYSTFTQTYGVLGQSEYGIGIGGWLTNPVNTQDAVNGWTEGTGDGVFGGSAGGYGVYGEGAEYGVVAEDAMLAPQYDVGNPDIAEYLPAGTSDLEAGDLVVLAAEGEDGFGLHRADHAYDTAVAGIISTEPGVTLGVRDGDIIAGNNHGEVPLTLVGRVPCKVDAGYGAIAVGDLLTTSETPGHAMRCDDRLECVGAIIGKALEPLEEGTGHILVLVMLH
jgi:hypothetical protein